MRSFIRPGRGGRFTRVSVGGRRARWRSAGNRWILHPSYSYQPKASDRPLVSRTQGVCGYCRDALPGVVIIRYGNLTPIIRPAIAPRRVRSPAPRKPDRSSLIVAYNHVHNPVENCPNFDLFGNLTF